MKAYNKSDMPREALKLFDQIVNEDGHVHDPIHFIFVFNACMLKITYYSHIHSFILFFDILGAKLGRVCLKNAHGLYQMMLKQSPEYARRPRCRNAAIDM